MKTAIIDWRGGCWHVLTEGDEQLDGLGWVPLPLTELCPSMEVAAHVIERLGARLVQHRQGGPIYYAT